MHTDKLPFMWRHKKTFAREFSLTNVDHGAAEYISTIRRRRGTCQALLGKFSFRPGKRTGTFREKRTQSASQLQAALHAVFKHQPAQGMGNAVALIGNAAEQSFLPQICASLFLLA